MNETVAAAPQRARQGYSGISIALHWAVAVGFLAMFLIGNAFEELPRGPERRELLMLHIALGAVLFPLFATRVAWRLAEGWPAEPAQPLALKLLARWVPRLLLLVIAAQALTGPIAVWTAGNPIEVFGLFAIPSPTGRIGLLHEVAEKAHVIGAKIWIPLVAIHVLGALKHHFVDRDRVLLRMLRPRTALVPQKTPGGTG